MATGRFKINLGEKLIVIGDVEKGIGLSRRLRRRIWRS